MKKYKKLQKQVDDSLSEMRDEQLLQALKAQTCQNQERKATKSKQKLTWAFASVALVLLICVVSLTVLAPKIDDDAGHSFIDNEPNFGDDEPLAPPPSSDTDPDGDAPIYSVDNERQGETSFEELNSLTQSFDVFPLEGFSVSKYVDGVTEDVLYFVVSGENQATDETYSIKIIVNPYYEENGYNYDYNLEAQIGIHKMSYFEECEKESEGICIYTNVAKIITQSERIFIQYEGKTMDKPNAFITSIKEILK